VLRFLSSLGFTVTSVSSFAVVDSNVSISSSDIIYWAHVYLEICKPGIPVRLGLRWSVSCGQHFHYIMLSLILRRRLILKLVQLHILFLILQLLLQHGIYFINYIYRYPAYIIKPRRLIYEHPDAVQHNVILIHTYKYQSNGIPVRQFSTCPLSLCNVSKTAKSCTTIASGLYNILAIEFISIILYSCICYA